MSTAHAGLAEIFFCMTVAIALFTSPGWIAGHDARGPIAVDDAHVRRRAGATTATILIYAQILVGATMRHTGAGLAIPDFPVDVRPRRSPITGTAAIAIHFTHRVGALWSPPWPCAHVAHDLARATASAPSCCGRPPLLVALVAVQVTLGALTVLSRREPWINSLHVVCGALVLTTSLVLTLALACADCGLRIADCADSTSSGGLRSHSPPPIRNPIRNPQSAIRNGEARA